MLMFLWIVNLQTERTLDGWLVVTFPTTPGLPGKRRGCYGE
jgi:hypothetical protein